MTFYLKTCYAYVLILICINLVLLGAYVNTLQTIDRIHTAQASGKSSFPDTCDMSRYISDQKWLDHYCTFNKAIEQESFKQYVLLFFHLIFDAVIFFWINSREGWLGWKSCERDPKQ